MSLASESKFLIEKFIQTQFYINPLAPSFPFRLFRSLSIPKQLTEPRTSLPLNKFIDPITLSKCSSHISIWSQGHLEFVNLLNRNKSFNMDKLVLKNPFKTQKFIKDSIELGIKNMVVDSFEQLSKIHQCRCEKKNDGFQYASLRFIWSVSDPENDLKQVQTLKNYNIRLGGLLFDQTQTKKITDVKSFIEKVNKGTCEKRKIRSIYLDSQTQNFDKVHEIYQKDQFFVKNKIEKILERTDFKMTDKCWIAAKVIGETRRKEPVLNDEAYCYLSQEQVKKGQTLEQDGKKWIISSISQYPELRTLEEHDRKGYIINVN